LKFDWCGTKATFNSFLIENGIKDYQLQYDSFNAEVLVIPQMNEHETHTDHHMTVTVQEHILGKPSAPIEPTPNAKGGTDFGIVAQGVKISKTVSQL
jgi:hypothetical protein